MNIFDPFATKRLSLDYFMNLHPFHSQCPLATEMLFFSIAEFLLKTGKPAVKKF